MKEVTPALAEHLNTEKNFISCDLYELQLANGHKYYYTDADIDITYDGKTYLHNALLIKRQQVKINSTVVVDTMTVTIYASIDDKIEGKAIMAAAHDGTLDKSVLRLSRCFFRGTEILGVIGLFGGNVEIKKCGGLQLELTVKANTQGLSQEFPRRKFYPQGTYSNVDGYVKADSSDSDGCLITPYIPRKEVLYP